MAEHTSSPTFGATSATDHKKDQSTTSSDIGSGIVSRVKEQAAARLSDQKERATDGLGSVATAVRQTTQSLRDQHHETVAGYVEQAADQIERLSDRLKNKDVTELFDDAQRLARRQPALFIGGAFTIGLIGARFLKSSSDDHDEYEPGKYGSYGSTSNAYGSPSRSGSTGSTGSAGDVTGGRSSDLGATGAAGYSGSNYAGSAATPTGSAGKGSAGKAGTGKAGTAGPSSSAGSISGSSGRDDRERF